MKSKRLVVGLLMIVILMAMLAGGTHAATQADIEQAIDEGVEWLVSRQEADGSWNPWGDPVGHTGFGVVKLEDRAFELGYDPFDSAYVYNSNVTAGLDFILSQAAISPCSDGSVVFAIGHNEVYNTGIAMMAIAASRAPDRVVDVPGSIVDGWTYKQVLQANVEYFVCSQIDSGGWRYEYPEEWADNSATGYAVLGLAYAESPLYGFECTIPDILKSKLDNWVNINQVSGDTPHNGGSGYGAYDSTSNLLRAGNLIFEMAFLGDTPESPRMQRALEYLGRAWNDPDWSWEDMHSYPGWYGNPDWHGDPIHQDDPPDWWQGLEERWWGWQGPHFQAMYCLMKGLSFAGVNAISVDGEGVDWFDAFAERILEIQMEDGSWPRDYWGGDITATEWALLTLERVVPPQTVAVDVRPTSCPNPLNVDAKGVLPVAVLGTSDFDVSEIDPASVTLEGVAPLRWSWEDVATPYEPWTGKAGEYDCNEYGPDGYADLTLKYDSQELVAALGEVNDGDVLVLQLAGSLQDDFGGTAFSGEDVLKIIEIIMPAKCDAGVSCQDIRDRCPSATSGEKWITPDGTTAILAYCHMDEEGNGWTLIYNRNNAYFSPDQMYHELPAQGPNFSSNSTSWFIPNDATRWRWEVSVDSGASYRTLETSIPPEARATTHATVENAPIGAVYENTTGASGPFYFQTIVFSDKCLYGCDSGIASWWGIVNVLQGAGDQDNPGLGGHTDWCSMNSMLLPGDNYTWGDGDLEYYLSDWKDIGGDGIGGTNCVPYSPTTQYRYRFWAR